MPVKVADMSKHLSSPLLFRLATLLVMALVIAGLAISAASASIQAAGYSVSWYTFDGGGGNSTGGVYTLMGTIGQPDAGSHSGGDYDLTGGFWTWVARYLGFLPLIKK
jgi:hypothetical protein